MTLLDCIYAATINPNLKKHDRHKPRNAQDFMPVDYYREKAEQKPKEQLFDKLEAFVKAYSK